MTYNTHYHYHCCDGQVHQDQREARPSPDHHTAHHVKHQNHHPQHILSTRTKDKLDLHYTMRGLLPEWWSAWDPTLEKVS